MTLWLPVELQWTLHHVLLDRLEREASAAMGSATEPRPAEAYRAFETLDAGELRFTVAQLETIHSLLKTCHHSTEWELERAEIERLLRHVTTQLDRHRTATDAV